MNSLEKLSIIYDYANKGLIGDIRILKEKQTFTLDELTSAIKKDLEKLQAIESTDLSEGLEAVEIIKKFYKPLFETDEYKSWLNDIEISLKKSKLLESKLKRYFELDTKILTGGWTLEEHKEFYNLREQIQSLLGVKSNE